MEDEKACKTFVWVSVSHSVCVQSKAGTLCAAAGNS